MENKKLDIKESILYNLWYQIRHNSGKHRTTYVQQALNYEISESVIHYVEKQAINNKTFYYQTWPVAYNMIAENRINNELLQELGA